MKLQMKHSFLYFALLVHYQADAVRSDAVMQKLAAVRLRGRKRECFG
jgi:tRNA A-37 threonylcarbamoyl transferase component Bud32